MRLMLFTENYFRGGGNRYLVDLANCAAGRFDEIVIAVNRGGIFPEELERLVSPARVVDARFTTSTRVSMGGGPLAGPRASLVRAFDGAVLRRNVRSLAALVRAERPDLVVACNGGYPAARACLAMVLAARAERVPAAMTIVGTPVARRRALAGYERALDRRVFEACAVVGVNADFIAGALAALRDMPAAQAVLVRNGLPDVPERANPGRDGEQVVVGCVSRVDAYKGVPVLVDAFERVAPAHAGAVLRVVGSGPALADIRARVQAGPLAGRIDLPGHFEGEVAPVLGGFDVFAFPSLQEGFPYAVLEAMRAGCAIVATSVGGVPEAIEDGVTGLLVPPSDPGALASALDRLLADRELRARLGAAARARFEREFTLEAMEAQAALLFDRALGAQAGS